MKDEPVGYLLEWTTPAGARHGQWYQRLGHAKNYAQKLGERGEGVDVRLLRTTELKDATDELEDIYDPSAAETRADWATSPWRRWWLRNEPRAADWIRNHRAAESALDRAERSFSRAGRAAARQRRTNGKSY